MGVRRRAAAAGELDHGALQARPDADDRRPVRGEQLGGFWVVQAADLDAALELAKRAAAACQGDVEVRPFQDE